MLNVVLRLRPSKYLIAFIILLSVFYTLVVICLAINLLLRIALLILIIFYTYRLWKHHLSAERKEKIEAIRYEAGGKWHIFFQHQSYLAMVCGDSVVTSLVCVLRFKLLLEQKVIPCVIFRDALSQDEYRRLLVCLSDRSAEPSSLFSQSHHQSDSARS